MILVYEASNPVEAHMILNLLEQEGLSGRIDGEFLQGGIGELQAIGVVRVMVEESNYPAAKMIINEWDAKQAEQTPPSPTSNKRKNSFGVGVVGFFCGVGVMIWYFYSPVTEDGVDYNGDGILDEKWTYFNYRISKSEVDRNFDGKVDFIYSYDHRGILESSSSDEDFNGTFETKVYYENGNAVRQESDISGDGFSDFQVKFKYGLIKTATFFDPITKQKVKIQEFDGNKLVRAEVDTTRDGILDTIYEYDSIEEIAKKYKK